MEVGNEAVPEDRVRQRLDIFDSHVVAPVDQSQGLAAKNQELRSSEAGAVIEVPLHEIRDVPFSLRPTGSRQLHGVLHHRIRNGHLAHEALEF